MIDKDIWQRALDSQSACNSSGLIKSLAMDIEAIWEEARATGKGTDWVNHHPIVILYLEQLTFLSGAELFHPKWSEAEDAAQKGAKPRCAMDNCTAPPASDSDFCVEHEKVYKEIDKEYKEA